MYENVIEHMASCMICKHEGVSYCPEFKLLDGIYNDARFIVDFYITN